MHVYRMQYDDAAIVFHAQVVSMQNEKKIAQLVTGVESEIDG